MAVTWKKIEYTLDTHALLSAKHSDILADTVVSGDVMVGNATPKWARLARPAPAAGLFAVLGEYAGETVVSWKTASINPGAAAAILQTSTAGLLTLNALNVSTTLGMVDNQYINWMLAAATVGSVYAHDLGAGNCAFMQMKVIAPAAESSQINVAAEAPTTYQSSSYLTAKSGVKTASFTLYESDDTATARRIEYMNDASVLIFQILDTGVSALAGFLTITKTTEQLRLAYDANNYVSHTIGSTGNFAIAAVKSAISDWLITYTYSAAGTGHHVRLQVVNADTTATGGSFIQVGKDMTNGWLGLEYRSSTDEAWLTAESTATSLYIRAHNATAPIIFQCYGYTERLRIRDTGIAVASNIWMDTEGAILHGKSYSVADNAIVSWTLAGTISVMLVNAQNEVALVKVWPASPATQSVAVTANIALTTGALSAGAPPTGGGTDGKFNISCHTDGKVYLKNCLGGTVTVEVLLMADF